LCVPDAIYPIVAPRMLEVMPVPLPDGGSGTLTSAALDTLQRYAQGAAALVLGPGVGRAPATEEAVLAVVRTLPCPAVVAADGLNIAAARHFDWHAAPHPVVLTPHPAEMARLLHTNAQSVQSDRRRTAAEYAHASNVVVVLKGAETVIAAPDGRLHVD